jgi:pseudouridine synthase
MKGGKRKREGASFDVQPVPTSIQLLSSDRWCPVNRQQLEEKLLTSRAQFHSLEPQGDLPSVDDVQWSRIPIFLRDNVRRMVTMRDTRTNQHSIIESFANPRQQTGWAVAGRLDLESSGLLVLTRSGAVARQLIGSEDVLAGFRRNSGGAQHESKDQRIEKEYVVTVVCRATKRISPRSISSIESASTCLTDERLSKLRNGVYCSLIRRYASADEGGTSYRSDEDRQGGAGACYQGEWLRAKRVDRVSQSEIRIVLTAGRKHHIRRMCDAVGLSVTNLKRVRIGDIRLNEDLLPAGTWRYLLTDESFLPQPARVDRFGTR